MQEGSEKAQFTVKCCNVELYSKSQQLFCGESLYFRSLIHFLITLGFNKQLLAHRYVFMLPKGISKPLRVLL